MSSESKHTTGQVWVIPIAASYVCIAVLCITSIVWVRSEWKVQIKNTLLAVASSAASQIDAELIDAIHDRSDMHTSAFQELVRRLEAIRETKGISIRYVYILRQTDDPMMLQFVADADSLRSTAELDVNNNGEVDMTEEASYPGDTYDITENPALQLYAFHQPITDEDFTIDQWGRLLSGYAPIYRSNGEVAAVLGIDIESEVFRAQLERALPPTLLIIIVSAGLMLFCISSYSIIRR